MKSPLVVAALGAQLKGPGVPDDCHASSMHRSVGASRAHVVSAEGRMAGLVTIATARVATTGLLLLIWD